MAVTGTSFALVLFMLVGLAIWAVIVYLVILLIRALRKYLRHGKESEKNAAVCKSLGEAIKEHRARCGMTQEFVAESLGVSRQAVSKWENGTSEPTTSNLLALTKLFGVSAEELLRSIEQP